MIRLRAGSGPTPVLAAGLVCGLALALAWQARDERYFSADFGAGYALGIAGLAMMTLLLSYSARKHFRFITAPTHRRWRRNVPALTREQRLQIRPGK